MAIELVTGHAGSAHVSSFDEAARMVHVFGSDTTVLGDMPTLLLLDANTVSIPACDIMMQGRFVRLTGTNNVTIESGTQEVYRTDTVMLRYTIDDAGIENCSLVYVRGEDAASASDAEAAGTEYEGLNISDGATIVDIPLVHVHIASLTPTAEWCVDNWLSYDSRSVVLYDNASGTSDAITLSESAANFEYIDIYYGKLDGTFGGYAYTRVYEPNGKRVVFQQVNTPPHDIQLVMSRILISGDALTWDVRGMALTYSPRSNTWSYGAEESKQLIYRVVGHRS